MIVCGKRAEMPSRVAQIMFDCTASVIVSEQPQNKPRCADQTISHSQVFKWAERKQDKARDVGDHFPVFGHDASHGGLSFKAKHYSSFRVSNQ